MATAAPGEGPRQVIIHTVSIGSTNRAFVDKPRVRTGDPLTASPITWVNRTGRRARFWFPNGHLVFDPKSTPKGSFEDPFDIPDKGLELTVLAGAKPGDYHYHIYCEAANDCAQGNSEPGVTVP
jgi:hypothetical protein